MVMVVAVVMAVVVVVAATGLQGAGVIRRKALLSLITCRRPRPLPRHSQLRTRTRTRSLEPSILQEGAWAFLRARRRRPPPHPHHYPPQHRARWGRGPCHLCPSLVCSKIGLGALAREYPIVCFKAWGIRQWVCIGGVVIGVSWIGDAVCFVIDRVLL